MKSVARWWTVSTQRWSRAPRRTRFERSTPRSRSKGAATSARTRRSVSGSRRRAERPARSITGSRCGGIVSGAATRCTGWPSTTGKVVRQAAWRRTTAESAAAKAGTEPRPAGIELLHEPVALLVERQRPVALAGRPAHPRDGRRRRGPRRLLPFFEQLLEQRPLLGGEGGDAVGDAHRGSSPRHAANVGRVEIGASGSATARSISA